MVDSENRIILSEADLFSLNEWHHDILSTVFSDKVGIINAFLERNELKSYGLHMFQSLTTKTSNLFSLSKDVASGGLGIGFDYCDALTACIGESIERYCMQCVPEADLYLSKLSDLPEDHKNDDFHLYSPQQYNENRDIFLNPYEDSIFWTKIQSTLSSSDYIYYPASLVYLPFERQKNVAENTSTGVATHHDVSEAITSGMLELIERDALMINHFQDMKPPELDINSIISNVKNSDFLKAILEDFHVKIYSLFSDIKVPIFLGYIWTLDSGEVHFGIGASASLDSEQAILKTLKECLFTYFYSKKMMHLRQPCKEKISSLYEHFLYYQSDVFFNLVEDRDKTYFKNEKFNRLYLNEEISKNGLMAYYKNLTTIDIQRLPLSVVKVIIPGLVDLNKSFKFRRLGAKRFWEVPRKLNLKFSSTLCDNPHPFP